MRTVPCNRCVGLLHAGLSPSEIANFYGMPNIPDDPKLAIDVGRRLCEDLLEPLNATFGRIAIRSAYRSPTVNALATRWATIALRTRRITAATSGTGATPPDSAGRRPASSFPGSPIAMPRAPTGKRLAYWIHDHLPYSRLQFFPKLAAFNISWQNVRSGRSTASSGPAGYLLRGNEPVMARPEHYPDFPPLIAHAGDGLRVLGLFGSNWAHRLSER